MGLKGRCGGCWGVIISMENAEKLNREQIERLLEATQEIRFEGKDREEMYKWITRTLSQQGYREQSKPMRGLLAHGKPCALRSLGNRKSGLVKPARLLWWVVLKEEVCPVGLGLQSE